MPLSFRFDYFLDSRAEILEIISLAFWKKRSFHKDTDYGHPEAAFFQKSEAFGLGQTNWAEI